MPSYRWLLRWLDEVPSQLDRLSSGERKLLFKKLANLLESEDPYRVQGVELLVEERFAGKRRIRQGNYRIIFEIEDGAVIDQKFTYKGKLIVVSVTNRRDTYK